MVHFAKWKIVLVLCVCALGLVFAAPNLLSQKDAEALPDWLPKKQISLGLDLQGGAHLLYEVGIDAVIRERLEAVLDSMRATLRKARIRYQGLDVEGFAATVTIREPDRLQEALALIGEAEPDMKVTEGTGGRLSLAFSEQALREFTGSIVEQAIEIVRIRIDETGVREPTIQRQGEDRILVQLPGVEKVPPIDAQAKMTFHLVDTRGRSGAPAPAGARWVPSADESDAQGQPRMYLIRKRAMVGGEDLVDAQPGFDPHNGLPVVNFRFDTRGARKFGDVTTENVGRVFAIVLDGEVISAPVIREPILGGSGQISGNFTVESANNLALLLRAGALPAPLTKLEERSVGPGLGADSIAAGKVASVIGLALVIVFMAFYYGFFGMIAAVALLTNMVLIAAGLSVLQATLTLPGIAGIVLTIGMAVDANVLVFERIREEVRAGRTPISAIDAGYARALTTIIDANLTTLIAAFLLYAFGSGPVRGFAVTLAIGIVTSMFTAIMLTRLIAVTWLRRARPKALPI